MASHELEQVRAIWRDLVETLEGPGRRPSVEEIRRAYERFCGRLPIPVGTEVRRTGATETPGLWVRGPGVERPRTTVLLLHSGGYVIGSAAGYRSMAAALSQAMNAEVLVLDYRRAPEHPHPAALTDALAAYRGLLEDHAPDEVVVYGDSAGGGLAVALLIAARDAGHPLPRAAICVSPWTDLTLSGGALTERADRDPIASRALLRMFARLYIGDGDPADPRVSPLLGDLAGLPPLLVLVGTEEVLHDDAVRLAERARAVDVDVTLDIGEGQFHIWPLFSALLPDARAALCAMADFARDREAARA